MRLLGCLEFKSRNLLAIQLLDPAHSAVLRMQHHSGMTNGPALRGTGKNHAGQSHAYRRGHLPPRPAIILGDKDEAALAYSNQALACQRHIQHQRLCSQCVWQRRLLEQLGNHFGAGRLADQAGAQAERDQRRQPEVAPMRIPTYSYLHDNLYLEGRKERGAG
ncbi:hypothetical protein D3C80_1686230 [compost metagenome]